LTFTQQIEMSENIPNEDCKICSLEEIQDGGCRIFQINSDMEKVSIIVLRSGDLCYAYVNRCPHFGMKLAETDSQLIFEPNLWIKCNVHYAQFGWQNGACLGGDCAGDSLQTIPLTIQNGMIFKAA
jgi:nitrite reductase/ring-hydroxylating ferredoxin subunit